MLQVKTTTTLVRTAVARFESTPATPILARIAVIPAKNAGEALLLSERYELHAGIDVSDGLSLDLSRMAEESGCGAMLQLDKIPIADDARRSKRPNSCLSRCRCEDFYGRCAGGARPPPP